MKGTTRQYRGTIFNWTPRGYGFIDWQGRAGNRLFCHASDVLPLGQAINRGDVVEFDIAEQTCGAHEPGTRSTSSKMSGYSLHGT